MTSIKDWDTASGRYVGQQLRDRIRDTSRRGVRLGLILITGSSPQPLYRFLRENLTGENLGHVDTFNVDEYVIEEGGALIFRKGDGVTERIALRDNERAASDIDDPKKVLVILREEGGDTQRTVRLLEEGEAFEQAGGVLKLFPESDPNSYRYEMNRDLFRHLRFRANHFPNAQHPEEYDKLIREFDGEWIVLNAIGRDHSMGFTTYPTPEQEMTRITWTTEDTRRANARFYKDRNPNFVPLKNITIGWKTVEDILKKGPNNRHILLINPDPRKIPSFHRAIEGPVGLNHPIAAYVIQEFPHTEVVVAEEATRDLEHLRTIPRVSRSGSLLSLRNRPQLVQFAKKLARDIDPAKLTERASPDQIEAQILNQLLALARDNWQARDGGRADAMREVLELLAEDPIGISESAAARILLAMSPKRLTLLKSLNKILLSSRREGEHRLTFAAAKMIWRLTLPATLPKSLPAEERLRLRQSFESIRMRTVRRLGTITYPTAFESALRFLAKVNREDPSRLVKGATLQSRERIQALRGEYGFIGRIQRRVEDQIRESEPLSTLFSVYDDKAQHTMVRTVTTEAILGARSPKRPTLGVIESALRKRLSGRVKVNKKGLVPQLARVAMAVSRELPPTSSRGAKDGGEGRDKFGLTADDGGEGEAGQELNFPELREKILNLLAQARLLLRTPATHLKANREMAERNIRARRLHETFGNLYKMYWDAGLVAESEFSRQRVFTRTKKGEGAPQFVQAVGDAIDLLVGVSEIKHIFTRLSDDIRPALDGMKKRDLSQALRAEGIEKHLTEMHNALKGGDLKRAIRQLEDGLGPEPDMLPPAIQEQLKRAMGILEAVDRRLASLEGGGTTSVADGGLRFPAIHRAHPSTVPTDLRPFWASP